MAPAAVTDSHLLEIWAGMNDKLPRVHVGIVNFSVDQYVRISKEKMKFAKGSEQSYNDEICKIIKVIRKTPAPCTSRRILPDDDLRAFIWRGITPCAHHET